MKKRLLSLVLCLVMVFSLFPFAAAADDTDPDPAEGIHLNKTYDPETQMLTLESYVEGGITVSKKVQPCDIVLVLDVSGSMDDWITVGNFSTGETGQLDTVRGAEEGFYRVDTSVLFLDLGTRELRYNNGRWQYKPWLGNWRDVDSTWLFNMEAVEVKKINALKIAADGFIDEVQNNAEENEVDHKISIVKFAGTRSDTIGNNFYNGNSYNYSQIVTNLSPVSTTAQATSLKNVVDSLKAGGATQADFGLAHANTVLSAANDPNRSKVVVLLTDGEPTSGNSFESTVANAAVRNAKTLKDNGTLVYSVGVYDSVTSDTHRYMNAVSSNHPNATTYTQGETYSHDKYMTASSAARLQEIFQEIAEAIGGASVELTEETIIRDVMSTNFELSGVTAADTSKIEVYTADYDGKDPATGEDTFKAPVVFNGATIEVTNGNQVDVSGFDFSENWVGYDESTVSNHGKKLIIKIPVEPAAGAAGTVDTNDSSSGIYVDGEQETPVKPFPVPSFEMQTVTNVIDFNAKMKLATSADPAKLKVANVENGKFNVSGTDLLYQLDTEAQSGKSAVINGQYSVADVATAWGIPVGSAAGTGASWVTYNVVPASSVYYDDQLANATVTVGDGSGYNADIDGDEDDTNSTGAVALANEGTFYFTFYGKGIDVYCTTDTNSKYVTASLFRATEEANGEAACTAANRVNSQTTMRNYSETARFNVPTLSFDCPKVGLYTLRIKTLAASNYKLDGVRVYNPTDEELLADTDEANALFIDLRKDLINNSESVNISTTNPMAGETPDPNGVKVYTGSLFIDGTPEKSLILRDMDGDPITDTMGDGDAMFQTQFDVYKHDGPKNEIYLDSEESLVFAFHPDVQSAIDAGTAKVYLGISAPETGTSNGDVKVCGTKLPEGVESYVDMYYDVTDLVKDQKAVTIVNEGGDRIALTNLKITGEYPESLKSNTTSLYAEFNGETIRNAARPSAVVAPTEDPTPTIPSVRDIVRQLVSTFVRGLFDSVSRLFNF